MILAALSLVIVSVNGFTTISIPKSTSTTALLMFKENNENPLDEYDNMLNLFKPLEDSSVSEADLFQSNLLDIVYEQTSILKENEIEKKSIIKKPKSPQSEWEHWDAFMEEELGDLDADLTDDKKWVLEVRDIVEQRRGMSIWSKTNEQDIISREIKKTQAVKPLAVPEPVASIITSVFLDQSKKISDIKKDDPLAYVTVRKFMMDLKKKSKKDPVMQTKVELSKVRIIVRMYV
jgi:hypothetical protein